MTRIHYTVFTALVAANALINPAAVASLPGYPDDDGKRWYDGDDEKCHDDTRWYDDDDKKCHDDDKKHDDDDNTCDEIGVEIDDLTDLGKALKVEGTASCLDDDEDAEVRVTARGIAIIGCANPSGKGIIPPGQPKEEVEVEVTGSATIDKDDIGDDNTADFTVIADDIEDDDFEDACKEKWTPVLLDIRFTDVTVKVVQGDEVGTTECDIDTDGDVIEDFTCD